MYRYKKEGHGIIIKTTPKIDEKFISKVHEYSPDKIFVLDIAMVEQDFIDSAGVPIVWIDHHDPLERNGIVYFNPRIIKKADNTSVTEMCYNVVKRDLWIAMIGAVGDWQLPSFAKDFVKKYPKLLDKKIDNPEDALFGSPLGKLVDAVSFVLKGRTGEVMKCVKIMTRIETPEEILEQQTPRGRFIYSRYISIKKDYDELLKESLKSHTNDRFLIFIYKDGSISFTKDLANELIHRFPDRVIIVGRERGGEVKMSIRIKDMAIPPILEKALEGVDGYGGGHEYACGACVKKEDFNRFIEQFRKNMG